MDRAWRKWTAAAWIAAAAAAAAAEDGVPRLGCQMRTFGQGVYTNGEEFVRLVRLAGATGFAGIETNWKNLERWADRPGEFAALLKESGLVLIGAHTGGAPWAAGKQAELRADLGRAARFVHAVGGRYIVLSGSVPPKPARFADRLPEMAAFLDDLGGLCATQGVRLLYHNHWQDCAEGCLPKLCRLTDPARVGFAFDTGHAVHAGEDPAAILAAFGRRTELVHFADYADDGPSAVRRPPLGTGRLDLAATAAAIRKAGGVRWIVLEEEAGPGQGPALAKNGLSVMRAAFPESVERKSP